MPAAKNADSLRRMVKNRDAMGFICDSMKGKAVPYVFQGRILADYDGIVRACP